MEQLCRVARGFLEHLAIDESWTRPMRMASNHWPHVINLGNSIIGVSILAMPFCFQQCGIILGTVLLLFCTWLTLVSCQLLMKAGITSRWKSYEFLAYHTLGVAGKFAIEFEMIGLQLGTLIAQIVIIGDLGPSIVSKLTGFENTPALRSVLIMTLCFFIGLPLGLLKDLRALSSGSTLCICFYTVFVFYIIGLSIPNMWEGNWVMKVRFWRTEGLFQCLPIFSLAFGCQTQLFIMYNVLPEPSFKVINSIVSSAVNICSVAYLLVGFFGYIVFSSLEINGDIMTHLEPTMFSDVMKLCFVMSVAMTFPLIIFPCRASLYTMLCPKKPKSGDSFEQDIQIPEFHFRLITLGIIIVSMVIGISVPNVEFILGLNGATMGTLICYIMPALFFLKVMSATSEGKRLAQLVLVIGISILLLSTFTTLNSQDKTHHHSLRAMEKQPLDVPLEKNSKDRDQNKDSHRHEPPIPKPPDEVLMQERENKLQMKLDSRDDKISAIKAKPKDDAKKVVKDEKQQADLFQKLEEQHEEQKKILEEQRELLKELKEHRKEAHSEKSQLKNADDKLKKIRSVQAQQAKVPQQQQAGQAPQQQQAGQAPQQQQAGQAPQQQQAGQREVGQPPQQQQVPQREVGQPPQQQEVPQREVGQPPQQQEVPQREVGQPPQQQQVPQREVGQPPQQQQVPQREVGQPPQQQQVPQREVGQPPQQQQVPQREVGQPPQQQQVPQREVGQPPQQQQVPQREVGQPPQQQQIPQQEAGQAPQQQQQVQAAQQEQQRAGHLPQNNADQVQNVHQQVGKALLREKTDLNKEDENKRRQQHLQRQLKAKTLSEISISKSSKLLDIMELDDKLGKRSVVLSIGDSKQDSERGAKKDIQDNLFGNNIDFKTHKSLQKNNMVDHPPALNVKDKPLSGVDRSLKSATEE